MHLYNTTGVPIEHRYYADYLSALLNFDLVLCTKKIGKEELRKKVQQQNSMNYQQTGNKDKPKTEYKIISATCKMLSSSSRTTITTIVLYSMEITFKLFFFGKKNRKNSFMI